MLKNKNRYKIGQLINFLSEWKNEDIVNEIDSEECIKRIATACARAFNGKTADEIYYSFVNQGWTDNEKENI